MSRFKSSLYGLVAGIIAVIILVIVFSILYLKFDFGNGYISFLMQVAYIIAGFISGFVSAGFYGKNGIVSGAVTSAVMGAVCIGITLLFGGLKIGPVLIITVLVMIGFGIAGGVLSLNVGKNKSV